MIFEETYLLSNGMIIPRFALGTWQVSNEDATGAVKNAEVNFEISAEDMEVLKAF